MTEWSAEPKLCPAECLVGDGNPDEPMVVMLDCCLAPRHEPPHWDKANRMWWAEP